MTAEPTDRATEHQLIDVAATSTAVVHESITPEEAIAFFDTSFELLAPALMSM